MVCNKTVFQFILTIIATALSLASCRDEIIDCYRGPEGEDAVISLSVSLPEMEVYTRSDLSDEESNTINNLWVGIYNARSGERTFSKLYSSDELAALSKTHQLGTLQNIQTKSGVSHIVAVANVYTNTGVSPTYDNGAKTELYDLLEAADSYEDYLSIAVVSSVSGSISTPYGNLPMSGVFYDNPNQTDGPDFTDALEWEKKCNETVYIPASTSGVRLSGAIHLRRLISQIKFKISTGGDIISLEPYQWQVFNVPEISWLHERGDGTGSGLYDKDNPSIAGTTNAGDIITLPGYSDCRSNYGSSDAFTTTYFTPNEDGSFSFDFWQMENKRTGLAECKTYSDREKEYNSDGTTIHTGSETGSYATSSGVYSSLCKSAEDSFPNNLASYVQIKCRIKYKEKTTEENVSMGLLGADRTADVTYTIHLGYINDNASDFRSLRNSIYTYNVKITDVKNLILEAFREGENQPGAEGTVADITEKSFTLDAHYSVFNISFTEEELQGISFLINAYYENKLQIIQGRSASSQYKIIEQYLYSDENKKFWDWIEFRATTNKNVLAEYKPVNYPYQTGEKQTFTLERLCNLYETEESNNRHQPIADFSTYVGEPVDGKYWFTVFINENVYSTGGKEDDWWRFVNQSPRNLYINLQEQVSSDGQALYIQSKYAISQRSIQTYYNTTTPITTAIGTEHINESLGLRFRWSNDFTWHRKLNRLLNTTHGRTNALNYLRTTAGSSPQWNMFVKETEPFIMKEITGSYTFSDYKSQVSEHIPASEAYLPTLVEIDKSKITEPLSSYTDPITTLGGGDNEMYVAVMNACMNRNRDLNGNGIIDENEVRWYLPTSSRYLRIILGSNSLETPLMDFSHTAKLFASTGRADHTNCGNTRHHYATSDGRIIWAEEGLSVSDWHNSTDNDGSGGWIFGAWEVRCARNLGINFDDPNSESVPVQPAYTVDTKMRTITMSHYESKTVRDAPFSKNPAVHMLTSPLNRPYKAFEYDTSNQKLSINSIAEWYDMITKGTDPCSKKGDNWRVPVISELAIMRSIYGGEDFQMANEETDDLFQKAQEGEILMSCTKEYYSSEGTPITVNNSNDTSKAFTRFLGANFSQTYAINTTDFTGHTFYVRCVRDIEY